MVAGSGREASELIAFVPPNFGRGTVEKIAVNAVMAGCRPEYMPVIIAGVEAMCDDAFDLHGVSATTNFPSPLFIVNGPARKALDINCAAGCFGPGWRANGTIGRALRLIVANLGGASARTMSMSTMAHPGRYTYCIGEHEEQNPWDSLAVEHGFAPEDSTVAAFAGEAPHGVYDHQSRNGKDLLITISKSLEVLSHSKSTHHGDTLVVFSPEHARTIADDGWSKPDMRDFLWHRLRTPVSELVPGVQCGAAPTRPREVFQAPDRHHADPQVPRAGQHQVPRGGGHGRALLGGDPRLDLLQDVAPGHQARVADERMRPTLAARSRRS